MDVSFSDEPWHEVHAFIQAIPLDQYPLVLGYQGDCFVIMDLETFVLSMQEEAAYDGVSLARNPTHLMQRMWPWWHEGEEMP